jgi:hypothetical protein
MHIPTCQHIKSDGGRCGSPSLRGQPYCYFHNEWRTRAPRNPAPRPKHPPRLSISTRVGIQHALNHIIRELVAGRMGNHRAALAINAIQLASTNLGRN